MSAPRWLLPVAAVSLAANLLIVGIAIGWVLSPDGPRGRDEAARAGRSVMGAPFVEALNREDRRALGREIAGRARDELSGNRRDLRAQIEALIAAISADSFDRDEVTRILARQRSAAVRRQELGEALLLDRLEAMTAEERRAYAERLSDRIAHRARWR